MSLPKSRSAVEELHRGADDGSLKLVGKDWSYNHPDIELAECVDGRPMLTGPYCPA